uniref:HMG box domain-containing protein n=1 Tax=Glossina brevipalpis TaxID=37001 RepID=A0A1A9WKJ2_9MUSC
MAPNKSKPNGFMAFTMEWKDKHGKQLSLREATAETGKIWERMNMQKRAPYNEKAKENKIRIRSDGKKLTCVGTPISQVEKEKLELEQKEKQIKRTIEQTVKNSKIQLIKMTNFLGLRDAFCTLVASWRGVFLLNHDRLFEYFLFSRAWLTRLWYPSRNSIKQIN